MLVIQVIQLMQVIQVIQVIQNIQIMQVRLAQMWVDFWVILQKIANCRSWTLFWILSSRTTFLQIIILDIFCNWLFWNILVLTKCRTSKIFCNSAVPYQCINLDLELLFLPDNFISVFCIHCLHILQTVSYSFSFFGRPCHSCLPVTPVNPFSTGHQPGH